MVTLPAEAATDYGLVRRLVAAGMDIARINCAHDDATAWEAMAEHVRRAGGTVGRPVKILMDLAGPKLRTGPIAAGPAVLKLRPARDAYGRVVAPVRLALRAFAADDAGDGAEHPLRAPADWLARLREGHRVDCTDARGAERSFRVVETGEGVASLEAAKTVYLTAETKLRRRRNGKGPRGTTLDGFLRHGGQRAHVSR